MYWRENRQPVELMGAEGNRLRKWARTESTSSWEHCQNLPRGTVCSARCCCHLGPTHLDIHHGLLDALVPRPVMTFHCIFASLLESRGPSSQNTIGRARITRPRSCHWEPLEGVSVVLYLPTRGAGASGLLVQHGCQPGSVFSYNRTKTKGKNNENCTTTEKKKICLLLLRTHLSEVFRSRLKKAEQNPNTDIVLGISIFRLH